MTDKPMSPSEAADVLQAHNEWRRGADCDMVSPGVLGMAIDVAVERLRADGDITTWPLPASAAVRITFDASANRLTVYDPSGCELAHAQPFLVAPPQPETPR